MPRDSVLIASVQRLRLSHQPVSLLLLLPLQLLQLPLISLMLQLQFLWPLHFLKTSVMNNYASVKKTN